MQKTLWIIKVCSHIQVVSIGPSMGKDLGQKDEKIVLLEVCKIEGKVLLIHILLAVVKKCSSKEVFLKISQNSLENMCQSLFFS